MYTFCIIGGGPAGLTLAKSLLTKFDANDIVIIEAGGVDKINADAAAFESVGSTEYKPIRQFRLGGHGHLWGGACPRLERDDFVMKTMFGLHDDWPVGYDELVPYYKQAEEMLSVKHAADNVSLSKVAKDNDDDSVDLIKKTLTENKCFGMLPYGNQRFFVDKLVPYILNSGIELINNSVVRAIKNVKNGSTEVQFYDSSGNLKTLVSRNTILCCGGLSNARILQLSVSKKHPNGMGNSSGNLGKYFMDHPRLTVNLEKEVLVNTDIGGKEGKIRAGYIKKLSKNEPYVSFASITFDRMLSADIEKRKIDSIVYKMASLDDIQDKVIESIDLQETIKVDIESMDPPLESNSVGLSDKLDIFGDKMLATNININDVRQKIDNKILKNFKSVFTPVGYNLVKFQKSGWTGQHPSGSTRMANNKEDGVVNKNLKIFDTENVYVLGSSVFPTVGYANPTLTIVALALRLSEHLSATYKSK